MYSQIESLLHLDLPQASGRTVRKGCCLLILLVLFLFSACPKLPVEPPPRDTAINLSLVRTGITTIDLQISVADTSDTWTFGLSRNDSLFLTATATASDTIIKDGGLTPSIEYRYRAYWLENGTAIDSSAEITAVTGDTTSHRFVWTIDTLGNYGSYLNDVAIIDENNVWVVGNIETDSGEFNAARWDGNEWEFKRFEGVWGYFIPTAVKTFSDGSIWMGTGCSIYRLYGTEIIQMWECDWEGGETGVVNAIWGTSSSNLYFVGNNGSIVNYDGSVFTRMEIQVGNDVRLIDVEGTPDGEYVFIAGMDFFSPAYSAAYQIHDGLVETLFYSEIRTPVNDTDWGAISSVSVYEDTVYFVTYQGLWKENYRTSKSIVDRAFNNYGYRHMVVQEPNDIFMVGGGGKYAHYNGASWDLNDELYNNYELSTLWGGGDLKGNLVVITGYFRDGSHGIVAIGRR